MGWVFAVTLPRLQPALQPGAGEAKKGDPYPEKPTELLPIIPFLEPD